MSKDSKKLNVAVVGYGYWGTNLVRNFEALPCIDLQVVVESDPEKCQKVQERYRGIRTVSALEDILDDDSIDAVAIATPVDTHFHLAKIALEAGKHVWVEKPMTETSEQARTLVALAERVNRTLFVDHTFLYTGAIKKMQELVARGDLGKIHYYDSTRVNLGLFQRDVNVISDLAVHDFSILDFVLQEQPVAVSASGTTHFPGVPENLAFVTLFYESGTIAHTNVSWLAPVKVRQILLGGTKKMIVYDDMSPSEKIKVYDCGVSFTNDPNEIYQRLVGYRTGDMWAPKLEMTEALRLAGEHFVECIRTGEKPITDGALGQRVVDLIEAATTSMKRRGETVDIRIGEKVCDTVC